MNKFFLHGVFFCLGLVILSGCKDESDLTFQNSEDRIIRNYILQNGWDHQVERTASGLYYRLLEEGDGAHPIDSTYVLAEYLMRELDGDGTSGAYLDATDLGLIQEHNLYPLFKFGGPALFRVGSTSYDPGLTEALKLMGEGDSMQFFMASALSNTNDQKAKVVTVRLLRVLEDISEVDGQQVAASLDTITGGYSAVLVRDDDKDIREYMYMSHLQQGSGAYPVPGDTVDIRYTGRFFNGSVFDQSDSTRFILSTKTLLLGFMEACRHLKEGGKATFIMPSVLGYGAPGKREFANYFRVHQYIVPPFSPLVFDIEILGIE